MAEFTKEVMAAEVPLRYVSFDRPKGRSLYVVDFGHGEIALEKWQVELFLLGVAAGLAVTQTASMATVGGWVRDVAQATEDGQPPRPWTALEPA